jgi:hypothetical protein
MPSVIASPQRGGSWAVKRSHGAKNVCKNGRTFLVGGQRGILDAMSRRPLRFASAATSLSLVLGLGAPAEAMECADLPSPVYGIGSSTEKPLFREMAKQLGPAQGTTLVFQAPGTCVAGLVFASGGLIVGAASYWDQGGCAFEAATGDMTCQACASDASCPGGMPHCRHAYCEAY